ncbi:MAG: ABC transporter ATP-binding protein [Phycisphaerales bacterium]
MLRVTDLRKRFGDVCAVDGLSLEVRRGEVFGLLGPNGAGKSTTIAMCIGLIHPDSGTVELQGLGDPRDPAVRAHLGLAPQSLAIYDDLSAEENMVFFGQLHGVPDPRGRALTLLERVGLAPRRQDRVKGFSGGMKRRLNLAVALMHSPELLLLDEPTAGVDPQSRAGILELVRALAQEGTTILYTTHYMEEAQRVCDRVGILDHGRLLALGTVEELIRAHGEHSAVVIERGGEEERVETAEPLAVISQALGAGDVTGLRLERPDLESVFLNLTGRSLRD